MSFNRVILAGHVGNDIELHKTRSGDSVCELRVATNEKYKDKNGELQENTEWHSVQVFGRSADSCAQYIGKGSKVLIEGKIKTRKWETSEGVEREKKEIVARFVEFMDPKGSRSRQPAKETVDVFSDPEAVDHIPF